MPNYYPSILSLNKRSNSKELGLSDNTIYIHSQDLLERTKSTNLAGLVIYAIEQGIIYVGVK